MAIPTSISRVADYYRRHGFGPMIWRTALATKRALFASRSVLFYCDLSRLAVPPEDLPESLRVERKRSSDEIDPQNLDQIVSVWNPKLSALRLQERFTAGASLWLIRFQGRLAGYGWTLQGRTIEAHYFPLAGDDVHLFDFHVFPEFRGQGINPALVTYILSNLAADMASRAFIEAAEWNKAQLSSLGRTPFRQFGCARKVTILGSQVIFWPRSSALEKRNVALGHKSLTHSRRESSDSNPL